MSNPEESSSHAANDDYRQSPLNSPGSDALSECSLSLTGKPQKDVMGISEHSVDIVSLKGGDDEDDAPPDPDRRNKMKARLSMKAPKGPWMMTMGSDSDDTGQCSVMTPEGFDMDKSFATINFDAASVNTEDASNKSLDPVDNDISQKSAEDKLGQQLAKQGINLVIDVDPDDKSLGEISELSMGNQSYILDLAGQKESRDAVLKEEVLEEAVKLYKQAKEDGHRGRSFFLMILAEVRKTKLEAKKEFYKLQDERLDQALEDEILRREKMAAGISAASVQSVGQNRRSERVDDFIAREKRRKTLVSAPSTREEIILAGSEVKIEMHDDGDYDWGGGDDDSDDSGDARKKERRKKKKAAKLKKTNPKKKKSNASSTSKASSKSSSKPKKKKSNASSEGTPDLVALDPAVDEEKPNGIPEDNANLDAVDDAGDEKNLERDSEENLNSEAAANSEGEKKSNAVLEDVTSVDAGPDKKKPKKPGKKKKAKKPSEKATKTSVTSSAPPDGGAASDPTAVKKVKKKKGKNAGKKVEEKNHSNGSTISTTETSEAIDGPEENITVTALSPPPPGSQKDEVVPANPSGKPSSFLDALVDDSQEAALEFRKPTSLRRLGRAASKTVKSHPVSPPPPETQKDEVVPANPSGKPSSFLDALVDDSQEAALEFRKPTSLRRLGRAASKTARPHPVRSISRIFKGLFGRQKEVSAASKEPNKGGPS